MLKSRLKIFIGFLILLSFAGGALPLYSFKVSLPQAFAEDEEEREAGQPEKPPLAARPSECKSKAVDVKKTKKEYVVPENCLILEEPIGGRPNYDLFIANCGDENSPVTGCNYTLWGGEAVAPPTHGPVQMILTREPEDQEAAGLRLLYNYLGLIYKYFSGIIVGVVVLFIIVGGIQMITSAGDTGKFDEGKKRIQSAIIGMILWFVASLVLYTINPTFFAF